MTLITQDLIDQAKAKGVGRTGIAWLEARPRTLEELAKEYPVDLLWAAGKGIGIGLPGAAEAIDACAKARPGRALIYAAEHLAPEWLDACAEATPRAALRYAAKRLTPERLDACAEECPWAALEYAAEYLTPERLDACAEVKPWYALAYAAKYLTPEQITRCKQALGEAV